MRSQLVNAITNDANIGPTVQSKKPMIQGEAKSQPFRLRRSARRKAPELRDAVAPFTTTSVVAAKPTLLRRQLVSKRILHSRGSQRSQTRSAHRRHRDRCTACLAQVRESAISCCPSVQIMLHEPATKCKHRLLPASPHIPSLAMSDTTRFDPEPDDATAGFQHAVRPALLHLHDNAFLQNHSLTAP